MSNISVILKEDIKALGKKNAIVQVKEGYAKNMLFPKDLAIPYTDSSAKKLKKEQGDVDARHARGKQACEDKKSLLEGKNIVVDVKCHDDKIFGSVGHKDISAAIKLQLKLDVDKRKVIMEDDHIKHLGSYSVKVKLHPEVIATLELNIRCIK